MERFKNLVLYGGLTREEFQALIPEIRAQNMVSLNQFSLIGAAMFALLFVASQIRESFATVNHLSYIVSFAIMVGIFLGVRFEAPKRPAIVMPLIYLFSFTLFTFGVSITLFHPDYPAVSAVALLLTSPMLFFDRPVNLAALTAVLVVAYCVAVPFVKTREIVIVDVWNMVSFGVLAVGIHTLLMRIKLRGLDRDRQLIFLSQTDLLTGLKNRNHYERRLGDYPGLCARSLACVYADVNGLHEMNNTHGHKAGDRMLQTVARVMLDQFGLDHTYRVGGDEFVAFQLDHAPEETSQAIEKLNRTLEEKGYRVSFGCAFLEEGDAMSALVRRAEDAMFQVKRAYYQRPENNRREREKYSQ